MRAVVLPVLPVLPVLLVSLVGLAACQPAAVAASGSWLEGLSDRDTAGLAVIVSDTLADTLRPAATTLSVLPADGPSSAGADVLFADTLRERGFAVVPGGLPYPGALTVRYTVSPVEGGIMLRLDVDQAEATCLFRHDRVDNLRAISPCSIRSAGNLTLRPHVQVVTLRSIAPVLAPAPLSLAPASPAGPTRAVVLTAPLAAPVIVRPLPPAPLPPPPGPVWLLTAGSPIREQVQGWAMRAGWTVVWEAQGNWRVPVTTSFSGRFDEAAGQVFKAMAAQGADIRARFFDNNLLRVTSPGSVSTKP